MHTTPAAVEPYLSANPDGFTATTALPSIVMLGLVLGGFIFILGAIQKSSTLVSVGVAAVIGAVAATWLFGPPIDWDEQVASELSERYGVEISPEVLKAEKVKERTSNTSPSYIPLNIEDKLTRNSADGTFSLPVGETELYLLVDGRVLEVMTRDAGTFTPYDPTVSSSDKD